MLLGYRAYRTQADGQTQNLILFEDHYSPVGFSVPNFPNFTVDPKLALKGMPILSLEYEMYISVFMALIIMGLMLSLSFSDWTNHVENAVSNLLQEMIR